MAHRYFHIPRKDGTSGIMTIIDPDATVDGEIAKWGNDAAKVDKTKVRQITLEEAQAIKASALVAKAGGGNA